MQKAQSADRRRAAH